MPLKWSLWSAEWFPRKPTILVRVTFELFKLLNCSLPVYTAGKILLTPMFPFLRCVDRRVGGYWCLSCHCERAGHRCIFRLHPSIGLQIPLWPVCQWHSNRYWVRMCFLLENVYVLSCATLTLIKSFCFSSCMAGYINNSLSIARMDDQNIHNEFSADQMVTHSGLNVSSCRFVLF